MGEARPRLVEFGVEEALYGEALALRDAVLRRPLGLAFPEDIAEGERDHRHFALVWEGKEGGKERVLACLMVVSHSDERLQIRQMAVAEADQGRGHGRHLMLAVEQLVREGGFRGCLFLHARATAVSFYARLGYNVVGAPFEEVGLIHRLMEKEVRQATRSAWPQ